MTAVEDYQAQTEALAASTVAQAGAVVAAWQAGQLSTPEAGQLVAAVVVAANATAATLADSYVSASIEQAAGVPVPAAGLPPRDDTDRLTEAVLTILDDPKEPEPDDEPEAEESDDEEPVDTVTMRIERLARSEPLEAAQNHAVDVMAAQPRVIGWRRVLDADPCELCQWLAANGRVFRTTTTFKQHPNCNCQPEPVLEMELSA